MQAHSTGLPSPYTLAGAQGGRQSGGPHKAIYYSHNDIGEALMLEVQSDQLNLKWICADRKIDDHFAMMMKGVSTADEKSAKTG